MRGAKLVIERSQWIIDALARQGYRVIGPTVRDGAIVHDTVARLMNYPWYGRTNRNEINDGNVACGLPEYPAWGWVDGCPT